MTTVLFPGPQLGGNPYTPAQHEDLTALCHARMFSDALREYEQHRRNAMRAEGAGDALSARRSRTEARVALHCYPDLLALVEGVQPTTEES